MPKITIDELLAHLENRNCQEHRFPGLELKSSWQTEHGEDISAIANKEPFEGGWLVVGVSDDGKPTGRDESWVKKQEQLLSNQCLQWLSPSWAISTLEVRPLSAGWILAVNIINPGEVVTWKERAYALVGTSSREMKPDEQLSLAMRLPGDDYSRTNWHGDVDGALVLDFAKKLKEASRDESYKDIDQLAPKDALSKLGVLNTTAARILFGDGRVRIVHYDQNDDILDQAELRGAYRLLQDEFIFQIQSWTRKQGSIVQGHSVAAVEEDPYPVKALREVLANAVAHALYAREHGNIVVEMRPNRLTVRNNTTLESRAFINKWFSNASQVKNKLLMNILRVAKFTDELGTGKNRIFRQMIEGGRREPIMEFTPAGAFGRWTVTLYNDQTNERFMAVVERLRKLFNGVDQQRIAAALVLWRDKPWNEILERLDEHYIRVATSVIQDQNSPAIIVDDRVFLRRWVTVQLTGQMSKAFSESEIDQMKTFLAAYAFSGNRNGYISTEDARAIIGLSTSRPEMTQLSNLFRRWAESGEIEQVKKGQWKFLSEDEKRTKVLMMILARNETDSSEG